MPPPPPPILRPADAALCMSRECYGRVQCIGCRELAYYSPAYQVPHSRMLSVLFSLIACSSICGIGSKNCALQLCIGVVCDSLAIDGTMPLLRCCCIECFPVCLYSVYSCCMLICQSLLCSSRQPQENNRIWSYTLCRFST